MGWWRSEHGTIGDSPADAMDAAFKSISDIYIVEVGRLPTQGEVADLIEFCSSGRFVPQCGSDNEVFSKPLVEPVTRRRINGYQGASGPASIAGIKKKNQMLNIDPSTGQNYDLPKGITEDTI